MRILKKSSLVLAGCMLIGSLTGCTDAQKNYWNELKQASLWEQTQVTQTMDTNIVMPGVQMLLTMQSTAEMNQKTLDTVLEGNVTIKAALEDTLIESNSAQSADEMVTPEGTKEVTEMMDIMTFNIGACIEDHQMYLSKDYYKQLVQEMGMTMLPMFDSLEADYIGIEGMTDLQDIMLVESVPVETMPTETMPIEGVEPTQMDVMSELLYHYMSGEVGMEQLLALYETLAQTTGVDIPVVQEGNTYTVNLDEVQLLQALLHTCDTSVANLEALNTLLELQLTEEMIKQIQESYAIERQGVEEMLPMLGMLLDGKLVVCTEKQVDGSLQMTTQLLIQPSPEMAPFFEQEMGGKMLIDMKIVQVQKQVPVSDITSGLNKTIMPLENFANYFVYPVEDESTLLTY